VVMDGSVNTNNVTMAMSTFESLPFISDTFLHLIAARCNPSQFYAIHCALKKEDRGFTLIQVVEYIYILLLLLLLLHYTALK
jgi:hypothetical protein